MNTPNEKDTMKKKIAILALSAIAVTGLAGCTSGGDTSEYKAVEEKAASNKAYIPENDVELRNYNKAQELYDNPTAIQWCTAFPSSNSAPIITMPIAGKLTSSSASYFAPTDVHENSYGMTTTPKRSIDGLYHGDSFYRYGFTPGGIYVDYANSLELMCTTALTDFQRQNTFVEGTNTEGDVDARQAKAEEALNNGDAAGATAILEGK